MQEKYNEKIGVWYAILAYTAWGFLPLYWKLLKKIPAYEILAHRIVWSFTFVMLLIYFSKRTAGVKKAFLDKKVWLALLPGALIITINWGLYIWAVNANHVVEASMGYYINPLFSVLLALVFLQEKLNFWQYVSLFMAMIGVTIITIQYGSIPWVAIILAVSFGLYGLFKKKANVDSMIGLTVETAILAPVALVFIILKQIQGVGAWGNVPLTTEIFLIFSGVATAVPLLWFAQAANRIPLSLLGFIQYLAPTISLFLGVFVYKEPFTHTHLVSFGFIWAALLIYSLSKTNIMKSLQVAIIGE